MNEEQENLESVDPAAEEVVSAGEISSEESPSEVDVLKQQLEELNKQLEGSKDLYLRTLADFQNFRKRSEEQMGQSIQFANREFILGLLPAVDNFERAMTAAERTQSYEALIGGVSATHRQVTEYLKKIGIEIIESVGKEFDPQYHEAVMRVEEGDEPENTVVEELQKGYILHGRVLRPAMVKVKVDG